MPTKLSRLTTDDLPAALPGLTDTLHASVHDGASVGFVLPFPRAEAERFWTQRVFPAVRSSDTALFAALRDGEVIGTVQLGLAMMPNQPHRADVAKMLVHPDHRRKGLARDLMAMLLDHARGLGKTLLVLDTRSGDPAQSLYRQAGFEIAGEIPGYCRNPFSDRFESTTYMYKVLSGDGDSKKPLPPQGAFR